MSERRRQRSEFPFTLDLALAGSAWTTEMSENSKVTASHLRRQAFIYPRQSSTGQLERNVESTARQYALVEYAFELGFPREQIVVIDDDLGVTADGTVDREEFARLTAEVALGHAGLVLVLSACASRVITVTFTGCLISVALLTL